MTVGGEIVYGVRRRGKGTKSEEAETPERYTPDDLGRYKVRDAGAGNRNFLAVRLGNPCMEALGAVEGDYIVVEEEGDTLRVRLDDDEG